MEDLTELYTLGKLLKSTTTSHSHTIKFNVKEIEVKSMSCFHFYICLKYVRNASRSVFKYDFIKNFAENKKNSFNEVRIQN